MASVAGEFLLQLAPLSRTGGLLFLSLCLAHLRIPTQPNPTAATTIWELGRGARQAGTTYKLKSCGDFMASHSYYFKGGNSMRMERF